MKPVPLPESSPASVSNSSHSDNVASNSAEIGVPRPLGPRPLRVTHAVLSLDAGGLERMVLDLIDQARVQGHRADALCLERPGLLADQARERGARVISLDKRLGVRPWMIRQARRALKDLKPDLVHTHQIGVLAYVGPAARSLGIPVLHTEHGKHYHRRGTRWLGRLAARFAGIFCAVSQDIAEAAVAHRVVPARNVQVVPNGIPRQVYETVDPAEVAALRRDLDLPPEARIVGTVGRLDPVKRQDRLILGFERLLDRVPSARLVIVGEGPSRPDLEQLIAARGLGSLVHLAGYQNHPERWYNLFDVFVLTSASEGHPLSVLEAWASGKAVVASRVGGLPELIEEGRTGLLYNADDLDGLARCLAELLDDPETADALGAAGRARVAREFDAAGMFTRYIRLYQKLISHLVCP